MDWNALLPAGVGGSIVAIGWLVSHHLNKSRDIAAEKREMQTKFLIDAYRRLEGAASRPLIRGSKHVDDLESALADIQLLGTSTQVNLAGDCSAQARETGVIELKPLLCDLRSTLRCELDLDSVENPIVFFRL